MTTPARLTAALIAAASLLAQPATNRQPLAVPPLEVKLWAAEPNLVNPTNIDIDSRGRIWVLEAVNYRRRLKGEKDYRNRGDRIVILEDTNHDGKADKAKIFAQDISLRSPLGIAVLGDKVIVSQSPDIISLEKERSPSDRTFPPSEASSARRRSSIPCSHPARVLRRNTMSGFSKPSPRVKSSASWGGRYSAARRSSQRNRRRDPPQAIRHREPPPQPPLHDAGGSSQSHDRATTCRPAGLSDHSAIAVWQSDCSHCVEGVYHVKQKHSGIRTVSGRNRAL